MTPQDRRADALDTLEHALDNFTTRRRASAILDAIDARIAERFAQLWTTEGMVGQEYGGNTVAADSLTSDVVSPTTHTTQAVWHLIPGLIIDALDDVVSGWDSPDGSGKPLVEYAAIRALAAERDAAQEAAKAAHKAARRWSEAWGHAATRAEKAERELHVALVDRDEAQRHIVADGEWKRRAEKAEAERDEAQRDSRRHYARLVSADFRAEKAEAALAAMRGTQEPVGWVNMNEGGSGTMYPIQAGAQRWGYKYDDEVAVALYRHPAPAAPVIGACVEHADKSYSTWSVNRSRSQEECECFARSSLITRRGVARALVLGDVLAEEGKP